MLTLKHPVTGDSYRAEDGLVRVERAGQVGYFRADGSHVRGDVLYADPQMCVWIAPGHARPAPPNPALKLLSLGGNIAHVDK